MASKEAKTKCCGKTNDEMSLPKSEPAKKRGHKRQLKNNENQLKCVNTRSKSKAKMRLNELPMPEPVRKKAAHKTLNKKYIVEAWSPWLLSTEGVNHRQFQQYYLLALIHSGCFDSACSFDNSIVIQLRSFISCCCS